MKRKERLNIIRNIYTNRSLLNPLLAAFFPTIIIILSLMGEFNPFVIEHYGGSDNSTNWFADVEGDGKKEFFRLIVDVESMTRLFVYNDQDRIIHQFNYKGTPAKVRDPELPGCFEIIPDSVKEVIFFTQSEDSVFLNMFSYKKQDKVLEGRFITTIGGVNEHHDFNVFILGAEDINSDQYKELYISVSGAFSLYPRRVFRYDYANDSLIMSLNTGASTLRGNLTGSGDSLRVMVAGMGHSNVSPDYPYPYHDSCSWVLAFDKDLNLAYEPLAYGTAPSNVGNFVQRKGSTYFISYSNNASTDSCFLVKIDRNGRVLDEKSLGQNMFSHITPVRYGNKDLYLAQGGPASEFFLLDLEKMKLKPTDKFEAVKGGSFILNDDILKDDKWDYIYGGRTGGSVWFCSRNFKHAIHFHTIREGTLRVSYRYLEGKDQAELILLDGKDAYYYRIAHNPVYFMRIFWWFLIYIFSVLFVSIILFYQNSVVHKRMLLEKDIANLQLQNFRNQLDPHFAFNALNSVGNAIYQEDKHKAYDLFQRFTRMIRSSLMTSDKVFRSLEEELNFTLDYLAFQKHRFPDRFKFQVTVQKAIQQKEIRIPKLLVQGYVENAVKHAFFNVNYEGLICIDIREKEASIIIVIEDNGIGITTSKQQGNTSGTQKGETLLTEQVTRINQLYKTKIKVHVSDKSQINPNQSGTRVEVEL